MYEWWIYGRYIYQTIPIPIWHSTFVHKVSLPLVALSQQKQLLNPNSFPADLARLSIRNFNYLRGNLNCQLSDPNANDMKIRNVHIVRIFLEENKVNPLALIARRVRFALHAKEGRMLRAGYRIRDKAAGTWDSGHIRVRTVPGKYAYLVHSCNGFVSIVLNLECLFGSLAQRLWSNQITSSMQKPQGKSSTGWRGWPG